MLVTMYFYKKKLNVKRVKNLFAILTVNFSDPIVLGGGRDVNRGPRDNEFLLKLTDSFVFMWAWKVTSQLVWAVFVLIVIPSRNGLGEPPPPPATPHTILGVRAYFKVYVYHCCTVYYSVVLMS